MAKADRGVSMGSLTVTVAPHDVAFFRLSRVAGRTSPVSPGFKSAILNDMNQVVEPENGDQPPVQSLEEATRVITALRAELNSLKLEADRP